MKRSNASRSKPSPKCIVAGQSWGESRAEIARTDPAGSIDQTDFIDHPRATAQRENLIATAPGFDWDHQPTKALITGCSGRGKTTKFYEVVFSEKADYRFVFDRDGEFCARNRLRPALTKEDILRQTTLGFCVWYPGDLYPGNWRGAFRMYCDYVYTVSQTLRGRKILCVDEIVSIIGPYRPCPHEVIVLLQNCRKVKVDCYFTCQSPNEAHTGLRAQMTQAYVFQQADECACEWMVKKGLTVEQIMGLKRGEYWHKNFDTGALKKCGKPF